MKLQEKHVNVARARHFRPDSFLELTGDPARDLENVLECARQRGIRLVQKEPKGPWHRLTMAVGKVWLLGSGWEDFTPFKKVRVSRHELTHTLGQERFRIEWFSWYALAPWRWALELNAIAEEQTVIQQYGYTYDESRIVNRLEHMYKTYKLKRIDKDDFLKQSIPILRAEWNR